MHFRKVSVWGNDAVGLFAETNDEITIIGENAHRKFIDACKALGTEMFQMSIGNSDLIGIYAVMNSNGIILPPFVTKGEINRVRKTGLNVYVIKSKYCAVGMNICANDKGGIVNQSVPLNEVKGISDCLGVEMERMSIAGYKTVGSCCVATNRGAILHNNASDEELRAVEGILGVRSGIGTINMGIPFVALGMIANSKGYVVGEGTSGFEMHRIDECLGFI
ncbi:MAG: translation initiation factor IF-6 [Candidatus Micrarchaeia archaeon]